MKFYLFFVCVNLLNAYFPDDTCCNGDTQCLDLSEGKYPIYCPPPPTPPTPPPTIITEAVPHKLRTSLNPVGFYSSMLAAAPPSVCGYAYCVGGYDTNCPALSTCVNGDDDSDPDNNCHSFDNCVGAAGVDCAGITIAGLIDIQQPDPCIISPHPNCVKMQVSVGSIYHDLCCRNHPGGAFCDSSNYQYDQAIGSGSQNCACLLEFRKAIRNFLEGHYWRHEFINEPSTSDLTNVSNTRSTYFPASAVNVLSSNWIEATSSMLPQEVKATSQLCAPAGTKLDCPIESDCEVSCFIGPCRACAAGITSWDCKKKHRDRWQSGYAVAGDAKFCCSGKFALISWNMLFNVGYGRCS